MYPCFVNNECMIVINAIQPPPHESCSGDIIAYRLQYKELETDEDWKTHDVRTTNNAPTTHTIDGLQPATSYSIRVAAINSCGSGPNSEPPDTCTTLQGNTTTCVHQSFSLHACINTMQLHNHPVMLLHS